MSYNARHWETHEPSMATVYKAEAEALAGSTALLKAMRKEFLGFAIKHGVTVKDASLFLMNAEGL